jgi:SNF2 family DNA or RNA helicase
VNPFDNKVVIIDEAHNFVSRIVNKIKKPNSISFLLYNYLMAAENAKIVLLTGTPIINYPNEIAILFNILRGFIKTWSMQVRVNTRERVNREYILDIKPFGNMNFFGYFENYRNLIEYRSAILDCFRPPSYMISYIHKECPAVLEDNVC